MPFNSVYTWALDGYGRGFIIRRDDDRTIIFCTLPGVGGWQGVDILELQDLGEK